jgi:hypothetical protein
MGDFEDSGYPSKLHLGEVWMNEKKKPPQKFRQLEAATEGGTLMGRLAERMASRDMIDELNLGPKGTTGKAKAAQVADNFENTIPSKLMLGAGLHEQTKDIVSSNFSNPIQANKVRVGSNMADQAKNAGNVFDTMHGKRIQHFDGADDENTIDMSLSELIDEHEKLVILLESSKDKKFLAEAKDQRKELQKYKKLKK